MYLIKICNGTDALKSCSGNYATRICYVCHRKFLNPAGRREKCLKISYFENKGALGAVCDHYPAILSQALISAMRCKEQMNKMSLSYLQRVGKVSQRGINVRQMRERTETRFTSIQYPHQR